MEKFDYCFQHAFPPDFDQAPASHRHRIFDVDYIHLKGAQGGDLFVTRYGWPAVESLLPEQWFIENRFRKVGRALAGATGAVYRVPVKHRARKEFSLVVKFSRAAQDVGLTVIEKGMNLDATERACVETAEFLSPFEEFGNLHKLRKAARSRIRTKQPLAIYSPPTRYQDWELGRKSYLTHRMSLKLREAQEGRPLLDRVQYEWDRIYVLLYEWIGGVDAEQAAAAGMISTETMMALGTQARQELRKAGWIVADHKPRHVILRPRRRGGGAVRHQGQFSWALIDYELLFPAI